MPTVDRTFQDAYTELRAFLALMLPAGAEILQAYQDYIPPAPRGTPAAYMNIQSATRVATNETTFQNDAGLKSVRNSWDLVIGVDIYDADADIVYSLFTDEFSTSMFSSLRPLFSDPPIRMPVELGEVGYNERTRLALHFHYTPVVSVAQEYADVIVPTGMHPVF